MSVAVLATFSSAAFAADSTALAPKNPGLIVATNAIESIDMLISATLLPGGFGVTSGSEIALQEANAILIRTTQNLPTEADAETARATDAAVVTATQISSMLTLSPGTVLATADAASAVQIAALADASATRSFVESTSEARRPSNGDEITVRAEQMTGRPSRVMNFDGMVELVRGPSTIDARTAEYHGVEDLVMASGNVQMFRNADCYSGDTLEMQMDTGEGFLINPVYQLQRNNAQGYAQRMNFVDSDRSEIEHGTYTTCSGTKPDWYMASSRLDLDSGSDEGVAYGGVVYFKDVPILAAPWMSFPISDARRSGVLPPEFYSTTASGPEIVVPYYFDIAPNRDATIYPAFIEKRGEQLGGEFRYLGTDYNGITHAEITPQDRDYNDATRYSVSVLHNELLMPGLMLNLNYNRASDNEYAIDYGHSITSSSQHLLPQTMSLAYTYAPLWTVGMSLVNYQVLQDANHDIGTPYEVMPRLFATAGQMNVYGGFDWSVYTEYANFLHPTAVSGDRVVGQAQVSYPIAGTSYFVTPKLMYHLSDYSLNRNLGVGEVPDPSLAVPTFSLDSGLYFERETSLFGNDFTQTLEPRLFYVKTPYREQSGIPLFDTGIADINLAQIFTENRFSGQDRVGDANQLTAGLISRAIEMNGQERLRVALAQRFSFEQPRVVDTPYFYQTAFNGQPSGMPISTLPSRSDFILAASGKLTDTLTIDGGWEFSQSLHTTEQMNYGFRWQPAPMQVVNLEYRFQQVSEVDTQGMKQIDLSAQWPIADRWYGVARSNFSIQDHRILDGLVGFEYKQDCWIFRMVAQRYLVPSTVAGVTSSSTTSLFFQLELNGLSKIGSNPLEVLKRSIAGYQPINQPSTQQSYQQGNY